MPTPLSTPLIRSVQLEDAAQIAKLSDLLGYPQSVQTAQQRINRLKDNHEHEIYVAQVLDARVIGWIHSFISDSLVSGRQAIILGLIVDSDYRACGVGRLLIQSAEQWAQLQGCRRILVSSNVVRQPAHQFYQRVGYTPLKTQLVLHKDLLSSHEPM